MAINQEFLYNMIANAFPEAKIKLIDLVGDQNHYELKILDRIFTNLPLIAQHRLVYEAVDTVMGKELHALKINIIKNEQDF